MKVKTTYPDKPILDFNSWIAYIYRANNLKKMPDLGKTLTVFTNQLKKAQ